MSFWDNPAVLAALREILIAVLVAILGLLGYHASVKRQIARLRASYEQALRDLHKTPSNERTRP
jgi:hypothetical protein